MSDISKESCPRCKTTLREKKCQNVDCENYGTTVKPIADNEDKTRGIYEKYRVVKVDTGEIVERCFVLRPDIDPAAKIALTEYAINTENEVLADDLFEWLEKLGR